MLLWTCTNTNHSISQQLSEPTLGPALQCRLLQHPQSSTMTEHSNHLSLECNFQTTRHWSWLSAFCGHLYGNGIQWLTNLLWIANLDQQPQGMRALASYNCMSQCKHAMTKLTHIIPYVQLSLDNNETQQAWTLWTHNLVISWLTPAKHWFNIIQSFNHHSYSDSFPSCSTCLAKSFCNKSHILLGCHGSRHIFQIYNLHYCHN